MNLIKIYKEAGNIWETLDKIEKVCFREIAKIKNNNPNIKKVPIEIYKHKDDYNVFTEGEFPVEIYKCKILTEGKLDRDWEFVMGWIMGCCKAKFDVDLYIYIFIKEYRIYI